MKTIAQEPTVAELKAAADAARTAVEVAERGQKEKESHLRALRRAEYDLLHRIADLKEILALASPDALAAHRREIVNELLAGRRGDPYALQRFTSGAADLAASEQMASVLPDMLKEAERELAKTQAEFA